MIYPQANKILNFRLTTVTRISHTGGSYSLFGHLGVRNGVFLNTAFACPISVYKRRTLLFDHRLKSYNYILDSPSLFMRPL